MLSYSFYFVLRVLFGITKLLCCCVDIIFWLERWEGVVVIAYVFGRSLVRCEGRRMGRERGGLKLLSPYFYYVFVRKYQTVF